MDTVKETARTHISGLRDDGLRDCRQLNIDRRLSASPRQQGPCVLWFTGLSGAGKSTIATLVQGRLRDCGRHTYCLDGDCLRNGINRDLGFSLADRTECVRRVGEIAKLMVDGGLIVLVSLISPFRESRREARELVKRGEFFEIFVDTPLHLAEARDPKGLYRKARAGLLPDFTGLDSPYEPPETPEMRIDTTRSTPVEAADSIIEMLTRAGVLVQHAPESGVNTI